MCALVHLDPAAGPRRHWPAPPGTVSGTPDDVARGLREVVDAGAETILLNPLGGSLDGDREQMERLVADVLPRVGD